MTESARFHSVSDLEVLTVSALEALWELVPTERQQLYKAIYERTRRDQGAANSDGLETQMVIQLLARYAEKQLVPVGAYWVPTPASLQAAAIANDLLPEDAAVAALPPPPLKAMAIVGLLLLLMLGALLWRGVATRQSVGPTRKAADLGRVTATTTPFTLEDQDAIIRGSENSSPAGALYPVNLRVQVNDSASPRIFVVQRRAIRTTEWSFEDNPDIASAISGLLIRPVLGLPFSEANAALMAGLTNGAIFTLQMNTGAVLRYRFLTKILVEKSDTRYFRQNEPGLVLVLIGERDAETGLSTVTRWLILAEALPDVPAPADTIPATVRPTPPLPVAVTVIRAELGAEWLRIRLRVYNPTGASIPLNASSFWVVYGYSDAPDGPRSALVLPTTSLLPGQAAELSLTWAWHGEPFAVLGALEYRYSLSLP